jgi:hypothetical protein
MTDDETLTLITERFEDAMRAAEVSVEELIAERLNARADILRAEFREAAEE